MVDFYDENGRSMRKFLVRKPIAEGEMTSPFGMRFHPILHYSRMHTGVDWAAPIGTPIYAAGNGVIIKAGWDGGYGRRVEIQHANGYVTTYNHMSVVRPRRSPRARTSFRVRPSAISANSGLATGPHLHYEVIINGNFVDPMAIKLPRTREFDGRMLAAFKRERDRIDQLMAEVPVRRGDGGGEARALAGRRDRRASAELDRKSRRRRPRRTPTLRELRRGQARRAQFGQATRIDGFSTVSLRLGRERAGGADSAARQGRAAPAAGGGPRSRQGGRARARRRSRPAARRRPRPPDDSSPRDRGLRRTTSPQTSGAAGCCDGTAPSPYSVQQRRAGAASSGAPHVEPERGLVAARDAVARFGREKRPARSRVERRAVRIALDRSKARAISERLQKQG